ncbi:hypothetical protein ACMHYQ_11650 [Ectopseudomonas guguanensis]|uniref:hypothetical protein n=1 Tax=Ectopseudomonas guguanensis TaxID=1198456 RepID=UPI0039C3FF9B
MTFLAAVVLLAKRATGLRLANWQARGALAQLRPGLCFFALANAAGSEQVKGRAPGSSERASPFRRTEARAKRTLERPPDETSLGWGVGAAFSPQLPSPRRRERDDKGSALGVARGIVTRRAKTNTLHRLAW